MPVLQRVRERTNRFELIDTDADSRIGKEDQTGIEPKGNAIGYACTGKMEGARFLLLICAPGR